MTGRNNFTDRVLARIITQATAAVPGVVTITSSWADIGTRSYPRAEFLVDIASGVIQIDSFIAVAWPAPITAVARQVQRNIHTWLKDMTGLEATRIDVVVEQTVSGHGRVTAEELSTAPAFPSLIDVSTTPPSPLRDIVTGAPPTPVAPDLPAAPSIWHPQAPEPTTPVSPILPPPVIVSSPMTTPALTVLRRPSRVH